MKKLILLSFLGLTLLGCSKDDDNSSEKELSKTWMNFVGNWKLSQIKRPDGTVVPYAPSCAGKECLLEIEDTGDSNASFYYNDCTEGSELGTDGYLDANNGKFRYTADIIENTVPVSLTSSKLVVELDVYLYHSAYSGEAKQLIFVKQ